MIELACARLLVCWVTLSGLVANNVSSLAQGQSANLNNGNTSDSQTIDSITSNNNTITVITLTTLIILIALSSQIALITKKTLIT